MAQAQVPQPALAAAAEGEGNSKAAAAAAGHDTASATSGGVSHLILVPCHAIYGAGLGAVEDDSSWHLEPFQAGEAAVFAEHIRTACRLARQQTAAADVGAVLLVFSGGQTKTRAGRVSEAASYLRAALALGALHEDEIVLVSRPVATAATAPLPAGRVLVALEEYALDSLTNVAFAAALAGSLGWVQPTAGAAADTAAPAGKLTIVGWGFKQPRFRLHCEALGIDWTHVDYVGVGEPADLDAAEAGEAKTVAAFKDDPLGTREKLAAKKAVRNPFGQQHPYCSAAGGPALPATLAAILEQL